MNISSSNANNEVNKMGDVNKNEADIYKSIAPKVPDKMPNEPVPNLADKNDLADRIDLSEAKPVSNDAAKPIEQPDVKVSQPETTKPVEQPNATSKPTEQADAKASQPEVAKQVEQPEAAKFVGQNQGQVTYQAVQKIDAVKVDNQVTTQKVEQVKANVENVSQVQTQNTQTQKVEAKTTEQTIEVKVDVENKDLNQLEQVDKTKDEKAQANQQKTQKTVDSELLEQLQTGAGGGEQPKIVAQNINIKVAPRSNPFNFFIEKLKQLFQVEGSKEKKISEKTN